METKEIKIIIPEGCEIDKENSTFECIKFKPIKKYTTYKDCCDKIFPNEGYYTDSHGNIVNGFLSDRNITDLNNATSKNQLAKLLALNQLINIAYYYNGGKCVKSGHYIYYLKERDEYRIDCFIDSNISQTAQIIAIFENAEDARAVIDNPNFRNILDTLCK